MGEIIKHCQMCGVKIENAKPNSRWCKECGKRVAANRKQVERKRREQEDRRIREEAKKRAEQRSKMIYTIEEVQKIGRILKHESYGATQVWLMTHDGEEILKREKQQ